MDIVQMLIASIVIVISNHLFRLALETHALVASAACYSVATINSGHRDLAFVIWALPNPILKHVFLEKLITSLFGLLTGQPRVIFHLDKEKCTLHSMQ